MIHQLDHVHWDIKPENILVSNKLSNINQIDTFDITLMDFGVSQPYINSLGKHFQNIRQEQFRGNLYFGSHY